MDTARVCICIRSYSQYALQNFRIKIKMKLFAYRELVRMHTLLASTYFSMHTIRVFIHTTTVYIYIYYLGFAKIPRSLCSP